MSNFIKCLFGCHEYEIVATEDITNSYGDVILGKVYVTRCKHCGKLKHYIINLKGTVL